MMKKVFSGLLAVLSASTALAGNFYNADGGLDDLRSGETLNRHHHMGLAENMYATLISKRLVVRSTHGLFEAAQDNVFGTHDKLKVFDGGAGDVLRFYGKEYRVTHWIEPENVGLGARDICLGVLDRDVEEEVSPIAVHAGEVTNVFVHSLSRHMYLHTAGQGPFPDFFEHQNYGSILYGRAYAPKLYGPGALGRGTISIQRPDNRLGALFDPHNRPKDLFNPIGGDSSSPCYVRLDDGGYALLGLLSTVGDRGNGGGYMEVGHNLNWLRDWERRLIEANVIPDAGKIQTVGEDHWVKNPDSIYDDLEQGRPNLRARVPHGFNAAVYLSLYEDLRREFATVGYNRRPATLNEAMENAKRHYIGSGAGENRQTMENVRVGRHPNPGIVPDDFDPLLYIGLNPGAKARLGNRLFNDVIDHLALEDYLLHGGQYRTFLSEEEAGMVPLNFNAFAYLALNADLVRAFGQQPLALALQTATHHYIHYGRGERRFYSEQELARRTSGDFSHLGLSLDFHPATYLARDAEAREALKDTPLNRLFEEAVQNRLARQQDGNRLQDRLNRLVFSDSENDVSSSEHDEDQPSQRGDRRPLFVDNGNGASSSNSGSSSSSGDGDSPYSDDDDFDWRQNLPRLDQNLDDENPFSVRRDGGGYGYGFFQEDVDRPLPETILDNFGVPLDFNPFVYVMLHEDLMNVFGQLPVGQLVERARQHYAEIGFEDHQNYQEELLRRRIARMPRDLPEERRHYQIEDNRFEGAQKLVRILRYAERFENLTMEEAFQKVRDVRVPRELMNDDLPLPQPERGAPVVLDERGVPVDFNPLVYLFLNDSIEGDLKLMRGGSLQKGEDDRDDELTFQEIIELARAHYVSYGHAEKLPYRQADLMFLMQMQKERQGRDHPQQRENGEDLEALMIESCNALLRNPQLMRECANLPMQHVLQAAVQHNLGVPLDFNPEEYKRLNPDLREALRNMENLDVAKHYRDVGRAEGKQYREGPYLFGLPGDFDPEEYLALNPDLAQHFGDNLQAAADHFRNHGIGEHRRYKEGINLTGLPHDFNPEAYRLLNPALEPVFGDDLQKYADHYFIHGQGEGRPYKLNTAGLPIDFDVQEYAKLYPEIALHFQGNLQAIADHYRLFGKNEGRIHRLNFNDLPEDFYVREYVMLNPEIEPLLDREDYYAAEKHYLTHGKRAGMPYKLNFEGVPHNFNPEEYLHLYPEVARYVGGKLQGAIDHYRQFGQNEGRVYYVNYDDVPEDFRRARYLLLNPEVKNFIEENDLSPEEHYAAYGRREGKNYKINLDNLPEDFDVDEYVRLNRDLDDEARYDDDFARMHYLFKGQREGRVYQVNLDDLPDDFDADAYIRLNPVVQELADKWFFDAGEHYLAQGRRLNLRYNDA